MQLKKLIILIFAFTACISCTSYQAEPLSAESSSAQLATRNFQDPNLQAFISENLPQHNQLLTTWDVDTLTMAAIYYQPGINAAYNKWLATKGGVQKANEIINPNFLFTTKAESSSTYSAPFPTDITLLPKIQTADKRAIKTNQALMQSEAAKMDLIIAVWRVRCEIRKNLLALYKVNKSIPLLEKQVEYEFSILQIVKQQVSDGDLTPLELMRTNNNFIRNTILLQEAREQRKKILSDLAENIGVPVSALSSLSFSFKEFQHHPRFSSIPFATLQRTTLLTRPDLLKSLSEYEASQYALQLEIAKQYPDLDLGPAYSWDKGINKWGFSFAALLPIFNQNQGAIAEAKAMRAQKRANVMTLQASILHDIEQARISYATTLKKLNTVKKSWQIEEIQLKHMRQQHDENSEQKINILTAELEFITLALMKLEMEVQVQHALGDIEQATYIHLS